MSWVVTELEADDQASGKVVDVNLDVLFLRTSYNVFHAHMLMNLRINVKVQLLECNKSNNILFAVQYMISHEGFHDMNLCNLIIR